MSPQQIQRLRRSLGWKQEDLAHHLRVTSKTVSFWETSRASPSPKHKQALIALAGDTPLETVVMPPLLNELDRALALLALMIAEGLETDIPVLDEEGYTSLTELDETCVLMGAVLSERLRALSEYRSTPNMFLLHLQRVRALLSEMIQHLWSCMSGGQTQAAELLTPFLTDMRKVKQGQLHGCLAELGLASATVRPVALAPIRLPDETEVQQRGIGLLARLVDLLQAERQTVISYSWAFDQLFGYRPDYWQTKVHAQEVNLAAMAVPRLPLDQLGEVGLDTFIVRITDGLPGRRHWPCYTYIYSERQWRAVLGGARRLHRSQQTL